MSAGQIATFTAASGQAPSGLLLALASIATVTLLLFVAWVSFTALVAWREGLIDLHGVLWVVVRGAVAVMLLGLFLR